MTQEELQSRLERMAEKGYREFSAALVPGVKNMLGIRLPRLRKIAKELAKEDWKAYLSFTEFLYFEEVMLQGMILGYARAPVEEILEETAKFVPKIDNWSVNDSFCTTFTCAKNYPEEVWAFLMQYKESHKEFEVRMVAVMLMAHYLLPNYIDQVLYTLGGLDTKEYYASMAVAWAFATAWAKYPDQTKEYLKNHPPNPKTYRRILQKGVESYRISDEDKRWMRKKRKDII